MSHNRRNIYQMYQDNGNRAGFCVRRDSWSSIFAKVTLVDGKEEGELSGKPPYFGNPPVMMDVYTNDGSIKEKDVQLSCPGTFAYELL